MAYETTAFDIADPGHRDSLLRLWTENMSDTRINEVAAARFRWFYQESPLEPPRTILSSYGETHEIIGCGSTLYARLWIKDRLHIVGLQCDFAVSRKHRLGGAAVAIQRALIDSNSARDVAFMMAFPNDKSQPIFKRVGYQVVAQARGLVKPLRSYDKLRSIVKNTPVAAVASVCVDTGLRLADAIRRLRFAFAYRSEIVDRTDARFDALWQQARAEYKIVGDKSAAFLNWRYADFKSQQHRFFALLDKANGNLLGFAVFLVQDRKAFVVNLFATDLSVTLAPLMLGLSAAMRREGNISIFICYTGITTFGTALESLGFRKSNVRDRSIAVSMRSDTDDTLSQYVLNPENWLLFEGEMDI